MEPINNTGKTIRVRKVQDQYDSQKTVRVKVVPPKTQEQLRKEELLRQQREIERKRAIQEKKRREEEARKKAEEERKRQEILKKERQRREEEERRRRERERAQKIKEEQKKAAEEKRKAEALKKQEKKKRDNEKKLLESQLKKERLEDEKQDMKASLKKRHHVFRALKTAFWSLFVIGICGVGVLSLIIFSWCQNMPEIDVSLMKQSAQTSAIYDINGDKITDFTGSENRTWVDIDEVPKKIQDAFVAVEDKRFYEHNGVDAKRFLSAVKGQLTGQGEHGGSTITQQLIKNVYLTNEVTYKRKAQEICMAFELEKLMSKKEILESYMNIIYFGSANYGIKAAANDYFGKDLDELTNREIAMLVGLPKNPNGYNPRRCFYEKKDMTRVNDRTDTVLYVMHEQGILSDSEYKAALADDVEIKQKSDVDVMYKYPALVEYAINDVVKDMLTLEGLENTAENRQYMENKLRSGGYSIYTTIDPDITDIMQKTISKWEDYPQVLDKNKKPIKNEDGSFEKPQVASVLIDPSTGYILSMIGNRDEVTVRKAFNRATANTMPIASTIKPVSIYAPAMEKGAGAGSITYNYKARIEGYDITADYPGGQSPEKPVTLREALVNSYNISAARFLCNYVGYDTSKEYLMQLGVSSEHIQKNGSGLALGTSGINMLELTGAYQSLANGGYYREPKAYIRVTDRNGQDVIVSKDYQTVRKVFSDETAWMITDILKDTAEEGGSFKVNIQGVETAGKTGTHENQCAVFAGYTKEYVSCIWVGSDAFSPLSKNSGSAVAAPIWTEYMRDIYKEKGINKSVIYKERPDSVKEYTVCKGTGKLAGPLCSQTVTEYFNEKYAPVETCDETPMDIENVTDELMGKIQLETNHTLRRQHDVEQAAMIQMMIEQGLLTPDGQPLPQ